MIVDPGPSGPVRLPTGPLIPSEPITPPSLPGEKEDTQAGGDRLILWVHGLAGNRTAWQPVGGDIARSYRANSQLIEYSDLQNVRNLDDIADVLLDGRILPSPSLQESIDPDIDPDSTIYVGHSLGGLVGRRLPRYHVGVKGHSRSSFPFGGIATVASPHAGSRAAGARAEVQDLLTRGCLDLTRGPLLDLVDDVPTLPSFKLRVGPLVLADVNEFSATELVEQFVDTGCTNQFLQLLTQSLATDQFLPAVAEEIDLDSDKINALNSTPDPLDLHKASIVTSEQHPVALRLMGSALLNVQKQAVYSADNDLAAMGLIAEQRASFETARMALRNEANYIDQWWHQDYTVTADGGIDIVAGSTPTRPAKPDKARRKREAATAYWYGMKYLDNLNGWWLAIQGGRTFETVGSVYRCDCTYYEYGDPVGSDSYETDSESDCENTQHPDDVCRATFLYYDQVATDIPTDGAATLESQESWIDQRTGQPVRTFKAENSNHLEIRNNPETDRAFNTWLFTGGAGRFFQLQPR